MNGLSCVTRIHYFEQRPDIQWTIAMSGNANYPLSATASESAAARAGFLSRAPAQVPDSWLQPP